MTTRVARLWQAGNPQTRVFLPDFWLRVVNASNVGRERLPKNSARFEVDPRMSRHDVRQYLEKIYLLPVRDVRIQVKEGKVLWDMPHDHFNRKALWKEGEKKFAIVFFKKDFEFTFPEMFTKDEEAAELEKLRDVQKASNANEKFVNRDRHGVASWWSA